MLFCKAWLPIGRAQPAPVINVHERTVLLIRIPVFTERSVKYLIGIYFIQRVIRLYKPFKRRKIFPAYN
ncbi:hypothetical protein E4T56_gene2395 [Termitomyces sp. T112]|nr:hypothetical protein E4T56_gene2395 [Termitomyces sp. T112]